MATNPPRFDRAYSYCEIQIKQDEDWRDSVNLQRKMEDGSCDDFDFTSVAQLDLYIRPLFDHATLIRRVSSDVGAGGELHFSATSPVLAIDVARAAVIATIPVGTWDQFLVVTYLDGSTDELWRGRLIVHPGKITA